jgi:TDG/mug DNA glycosylase family protein
VQKLGLAPILDGDTEILILGTLPSDISLTIGQYYANPGNDFWKLIGAALLRALEEMSYEERIAILRANHIGLWDAYRTCLRPGSMDKDIIEPELNDFNTLKGIAPNIALICFNGKKASEAEAPLQKLGYKMLLLPSSSGANRKDREARQLLWTNAVRLS